MHPKTDRKAERENGDQEAPCQSLSLHDRTVLGLVAQIKLLAQEAVATSAIEGITLRQEDALRAAYARVMDRWRAGHAQETP